MNPEYARLAPRTIEVMPVANETIQQLSDVAFGGLLQRAIIGAETYDVLNVLRGSLEESLLRKGYAVRPGETEPGRGAPDFRRPLPEGMPPPPFDAACYATVKEWSSDRTSVDSMYMRYRIEIYRVPTAELLYSGDFVCDHLVGDDTSTLSGSVVSTIRRSVRRALSALPEAEGAPQS